MYIYFLSIYMQALLYIYFAQFQGHIYVCTCYIYVCGPRFPCISMYVFGYIHVCKKIFMYACMYAGIYRCMQASNICAQNNLNVCSYGCKERTLLFPVEVGKKHARKRVDHSHVNHSHSHESTLNLDIEIGVL